MDRTGIMRLCFVHPLLYMQNGLIILLTLPQQFDILASPLRQKLRLLITCIFIIIDDHLHHFLLGTVEHQYIWIREFLTDGQKCMDFVDFVAEGKEIVGGKILK